MKTCCGDGRWKEMTQDNGQAGFGIRPFLIKTESSHVVQQLHYNWIQRYAHMW